MLDANDQLKTPEEYAELILTYQDGAALRLKDVADIVDGAENERLAAWANDSQAVLLNIQRQPAPTSSRWSSASRRCCRK